MKMVVTIRSLSLIVLLIFLSGCQPAPNEVMIGTWVYDPMGDYKSQKTLHEPVIILRFYREGTYVRYWWDDDPVTHMATRVQASGRYSLLDEFKADRWGQLFAHLKSDHYGVTRIRINRNGSDNDRFWIWIEDSEYGSGYTRLEENGSIRLPSGNVERVSSF